MTSDIEKATQSLQALIKKSRAHLYKPIQIAEILYRDRVHKDIILDDVETYRTKSKKWRDTASKLLTGSVSTSSAKFQDNLFDENAIPPSVLKALGEENRRTSGGVEKLIYQSFIERLSDVNFIAEYADGVEPSDFRLSEFLDSIEAKPGLRRSIDKVYEIVVFALFEALIDAMEIKVDISVKNSENPIFREFKDFTEKVFGENFPETLIGLPARLFRVGVTNAADRGLDMWGNFGLAIQIKHLTISEEMAEKIVEGVSADRLVIVCKDAEEKIILSLLNQLGWVGRIQSIVTLHDLDKWYNLAMTGDNYIKLGPTVLNKLVEQIHLEFPITSNKKEISDFFEERGYFK